ncbi:MAG: CPBP family intramembrane metalloprotease [Chloroflexi bacterium]|nr:CPBP family intramembrane metalloprotease [Chloroflexota bacterium]
MGDVKDSAVSSDGAVSSTSRLVVFLAVAFGLAWLLWGIAWMLGFQTTEPSTIALVTASMFTPGIGALLASWPLSRRALATLGLRLGKRRYYLLTLGLMPILLAAGESVAVLLGIQRLNGDFTVLKELAARSSAPLPDPSLLVPQILLPALTIQPLINAVFGLGEELGWRGYLLNRLLPLGASRAAVLVGLIWGVWHAPIIVMGWNYPGHPVLGPPLMVVLTVIFGVIFAWLRLRSQSVLMPALAHGALNAQAGAFSLFFTRPDPLLGAPVGLAILVPAGIFAAWLVMSRRLSAFPGLADEAG